VVLVLGVKGIDVTEGLLFVVQGLTWVSPEKEEMKDMLQRWAIAYPRALKAHLTFEIDLESELKVFCTSSSLLICRMNHVVFCKCETIEISSCLFDPIARRMEQHLTYDVDLESKLGSQT
jgi:hypothetical protein